MDTDGLGSPMATGLSKCSLELLELFNKKNRRSSQSQPHVFFEIDLEKNI
jgi:hypothetical protein